jgi:thiamine biosynthesis lipoprotein
MWTEIEIIINSSLQEDKILKDIKKSFDIFTDLEKEFSRFDKNSSLSKLNKNKTLEVSDRFIKILNLSIEINKKTNNYFNPLVNISNIWYSNNFLDKNFKKTKIEQNLNLKNIQIIWNKIILKNNQNLDFWWIVKWYTVDLVKEFLEYCWYDDFIVNAGWDMYILKKSTIAINSPEIEWNIYALLELEKTALSTSWTYKRKWEIDWKKFHHILNPEKNKNNNEILSISLIYEKCYIWDSYATACIAMWIEKSIVFLEKEKIDWVIIWNDNKVYKIWNLEKYNFEII